MGSDRVPIPRLEGYGCFACGTDNPIGLGLTFYAEDGRVCADVVLDRHRVGWQGIAHGGIVTTLLDEVMAWTVLYFKEAFCVTREIRTRFRKPVRVGELLTVRGELVDDSRRHAARLRAVVVDRDETVLAEAEADFALLRDEQLALLPEDVRADVSRFMEALASAREAAGRGRA